MLNLDFSDPALAVFSFLVVGSAFKLVALGWLWRQKTGSFECVGRVNALYCYPIKSCAAVACKDAHASVLGLSLDGVTDRHWMVVKENKERVSLGSDPSMVLITTTIQGGQLRLDAPGMPSLKVNVDVGRKAKVIMCKCYQSTVEAVDCGDEAGAWFSTYLKQPGLRLVHSAPHLPKRDASTVVRPFSNNTKKGDLTAFGFLTSYLVASTSSLHDLNQRLDHPVSILNFRPNIVVEGAPPFDEDDWIELRIGDSVLFRKAQGCRRCLDTTLNPATGVRSDRRQPLAKLRSYRCLPEYGSVPVFGAYCAIEIAGPIRVGDPVYVIRRERKTNREHSQ